MNLGMVLSLDFFQELLGDRLGIFGSKYGATDDDVGSAGGDSLGWGHDALLIVVGNGPSGTDTRRDEYKIRSAHFSYASDFMRGADHAVQSGSLGVFRQVGDVVLQGIVDMQFFFQITMTVAGEYGHA